MFLLHSLIFFALAQPLFSQGLLIIEASRSYSDTPHSVGSFWTSDGQTQRPVPATTQNSQETEMYVPAGFEPAIPASERPHTQTGSLQLLVTAIKGFFL
jgi:hypothetical protein